MTEEQIEAAAQAMYAIANPGYTWGGSTKQDLFRRYARAAFAAAEKTAPKPPPQSEIDSMWKHLTEVSSS